MSKKVLSLTIILVCLSAGFAVAETVVLKNGQKLTGRIIEQTQTYIKIDVKGIPSMYFKDEIERVIKDDQDKVSVKDLKERPLRPLDQISEEKKLLILRLIEANGSKEVVEQSFQKIFTAVPPEEISKYRSKISVIEAVDEVIPIYDKYYSEAEIVQLIDFFESPVAQKLLQIAPALMEDTAKVTTEYFKSRLIE